MRDQAHFRIRATKNLVVIIAVGLFFAPLSLGQFGPYIDFVGNSASYGSAVAQGSIFTVFGGGLGPDQLAKAKSYPLPFQLGGTSIEVASGGRTFRCPMFYSSDVQAAAILPSSTPVGAARLSVIYQGSSGFADITVVRSAFGIYTTGSSGSGPGVITGVDYLTKSLDRPARAGETVILWGTGLGAIDGDDASVPVVGKQFPAVEVFVGNVPAKVTYAGRSGCCAGLDQIVIKVPDSPTGCFVPFAVRSHGAVSNFVSVALSTKSHCSNDPPALPLSLLLRAVAGEQLRFGVIALGPISILEAAGFSFSKVLAERLSAILGRPVAEEDVGRLVAAYRGRKINLIRRILTKYGVNPRHADARLRRTLAAAAGTNQSGIGAVFSALSNLAGLSLQFAANFTPAATCTVPGPINAPSPSATALDAGPSLAFNGPMGRGVMQHVYKGEYVLSFGSTLDGTTLPAGQYIVTGTGGSNIGAFRASINLKSTLMWTNKSSIRLIDRTRPLTVTWAGGTAPGYVLIAGGTRSEEGPSVFLCVEDITKGTFTIPDFVLSKLPAANASNGLLLIAPHPLSRTISIEGLDIAYLADLEPDYESVEVR